MPFQYKESPWTIEGTSVSVNAAKVVVKVPLNATVTVSPETEVTISFPPAIVRVSVTEFAVVVPVSPATEAKIFCCPAPAASSAGTNLVPFHFRT